MKLVEKSFSLVSDFNNCIRLVEIQNNVSIQSAWQGRVEEVFISCMCQLEK